jgi:hypothetical protein
MVDELYKLLQKKYAIDQKIKTFITSEDKSIRFFHKKFVGELGEYYFKKYFEQYTLYVEQIHASNGSCDFIIKLNERGKNKFKINRNGKIRIEVKTRYDQVGINHIFGVDKSKFDLLAFVKLDRLYKCEHIGIIQKKNINPDKQKRIKYTDKLNPISIL